MARKSCNSKANFPAFSLALSLLFFLSITSFIVCASGGQNYPDALHKSILFFEGQRSGKLPPDQRLHWRRDSALRDGSSAGVDLTGGYYDAGDNIKFGFPMAFTTTLLAWSVIDFGRNMGNELGNALKAVKWGTDYLLKATTKDGVVFVQVGDAFSDHDCWERPEDMDTLRTVFKIDKDHPGSDVAGETAAALAASSIVFRKRDPAYSRLLLNRAIKVDYILGDNPLRMSYMVGYGPRYPNRIHHRGSSLPSIAAHPARIRCKAGTKYYLSPNPNPNLLVGAVVGGPNSTDAFPDSRPFFQESEPTTYINAPLVGLLAYFSAHT